MEWLNLEGIGNKKEYKAKILDGRFSTGFHAYGS
jgi:hypothetical protein